MAFYALAELFWQYAFWQQECRHKMQQLIQSQQEYSSPPRQMTTAA